MKKKTKKEISTQDFQGKDRRTGGIDAIYERLVRRGELPDRRKNRTKKKT